MTDFKERDDSPAGKTVLVVDDNDLVCNLLVRILENAGFDVLSAASGDAALDLFREHSAKIGCVLQDLVMPGLSGEEVIAEMKSLDPGVRIVVLSANDETRVQAQLGDLAVNGYLRKPFAPADLVAQVHALLSGD